MMESRPVSSRDYCEKASPDVAIFKKKERKERRWGGGVMGKKRNIHSWGKKKGRKWGQIPHFPKLQ